MCGIAGIVSRGEAAPPQAREVLAMVGALRHRGPDEAGLYVDDGAALGHARLAVIDLATGIQPLSNEDGSLWITYNGELYNYIELREDLLRRGHRFATRTDTEVLLHLFEEYGEAGLARLNGQYACAVWNRNRHRLFLARDPFGIRPLFYTQVRGRFYFASEMKAIVAVLPVAPDLDPRAWDDLFTFWTLLPGRTCFRGIFELPPGHCLNLDSTGIPAPKRYWQMEFQAQDETPYATPKEAALQIGELLEDAVRIRLRADVPVGCYLSGGLDSAVITAVTRDVSGRPPTTFGIGFEDGNYDESEHQQNVAEFLQTPHQSLTATGNDIASAFGRVIWHCEQPLLRTAPVPLFLLSKQVRQAGLKVVLTGEGADEVFAGYHLFKEMKVRRFWARQPASACRPRLLERLYPYILNDSRLRHHLRDFFGRGLDALKDPFYSHRLRWANIARMKRLFSRDLQEAVRNRDPLAELATWLPATHARWDPLEQAQYLEMTLFMSQYLLSSQGDRMAMAHGIEVRMPYLDPRLVALMARIPSCWKMPALKEKALLKQAVADRLPEAVRKRPKQPYRAPLLGPLQVLSKEFLGDETAVGRIRQSGIFDPAKVVRLRDKLWRSNQATEMESMAMTAIISTHLLHDRFVLHRTNAADGPTFPYRLFDHRRATGTPRPEGDHHGP